MKVAADLLNEARQPLAVGNFILPVRACLQALQDAPPEPRGRKRILYAGLRDILGRTVPTLSRSERAWLTTVLSSFEDAPPFEPEREHLLGLVKSLPLAEELPIPGLVNGLFVSNGTFRGNRFGLVQPLEVSVEPGRGSVRFEQQADQEALLRGFEQGVWAGQQYLLTLGLSAGPEGVVLTQGHTVRGVLPRLPLGFPVSGSSIGLAAAVAVISRFLEIPVRADIAFTGGIHPGGQLEGVGGIELKLEAAADKGIRRVFLPRVNAGDVHGEMDRRIQASRAASLEEVVNELFGTEVVRAGLERLRGTMPRLMGRARVDWLDAADFGDGVARVVIACVGRADPVGQPLDAQRVAIPGAREDGPILAICRTIRPHVIYLLYTEVGPDNRFKAKAEDVHDHLAALDPGCRMVLLDDLAAVDDPTDFDELQPAFESAVAKIWRDGPAGQSVPTSGSVDRRQIRLFVNVASGTPQMQAMWLLLKQAGRLDARLLQVRESRHVPPGQTRIREIVLSLQHVRDARKRPSRG